MFSHDHFESLRVRLRVAFDYVLEHHSSAIALCGGVCSGIALIVPALWFLLLLGVALCMSAVSGAKNGRQAAVVGASFGVPFVGISLLWILIAYPELAVDTSALFRGMLVGGVWLVYTIIGACVYVGWAICLYRLYRFANVHLFIHVAVGAGLWVGFEYVRTVLVSVVSWAPGHLIGPHGGMGLSGLALTWHDGFLWVATMGGIWSLSFCAAVLSAILRYGVRAFLKGEYRRSVWMLGILGVIVIGASVSPPVAQTFVGVDRVTVNTVTIAPIAMQVPRVSRLTDVKERAIVEETAQTILSTLERPGEPVDVLLLPEDLRLSVRLPLLRPHVRTELMQALSVDNVVVIDSARTREGGGVFSVLRAIEFKEGTELLSVRKTLLTPFGEYVPSIFAWTTLILPWNNAFREFTASRDYQSAGREFFDSDHTVPVGPLTLGVLTCSEIVSPVLYASLKEADVLLHSASVASVGGSPLLRNQMRSLAQVHAVSEGKLFVQAINYAPSYVVVPYGVEATVETLPLASVGAPK